MNPGVKSGQVSLPAFCLRLAWQEPFPDACQGGVVAVGNFDGVHRGHLALVRQLRRLADQFHAPAVVVTFDPHPLAVIAPERFEPLLTTPEQRARLLRDAGADYVLILQAEPSLLELSAENFFHEVLQRRLQIKGMVEGPNFRFGKDRRGDVALLRDLCSQRGLPCVIVEPEMLHGQMISSSKVRQALQNGDVVAAREWLGRPYRLEGVVVRGAQRGKQLGFPTANLANIGTLVPRPGVYAAGAIVLDPKLSLNHGEGIGHLAAVHIGPNPTFSESLAKVEVHLLDFAQDLLGKRLAVDLLHRIREVKRFESAQQLKEQIASDIAAIRSLVKRDEDGLMERIRHVLDREIRPALQDSGSDVEFVGFDRGVVSLRFNGACGACPSTAFAMLQEIERLLRERVPEVDYVETVA
ncbi:MAG: bifunctional riboflavin kinase/FAD synthetase [Gemmatales bacterium]|nr:bifunctional riboflavin kinase/FAD synthetase [Gemmatales bacterium]MDW8386921.1 bifunctional riboflavin kinase/FAD synthetase [Gemmatales bacterium]